jgi:hypothetical protein
MKVICPAICIAAQLQGKVYATTGHTASSKYRRNEINTPVLGMIKCVSLHERKGINSYGFMI